jgi:hypothetical protein
MTTPHGHADRPIGEHAGDHPVAGPRRRTPGPTPSGWSPAGAEAAAEAKLRAVHDRLTAAIAELTSAESWQLMLRTAATLPTYSPHNVLLIASQCPQATAVAGFHTWRQLGRAVRKGETGLAILAPVLRQPTRRDPAQQGGTAARSDGPVPTSTTPRPERPGTGGADTAAGPEGARESGGLGGDRRVVGFRVVHVFDISQTDGPDLPAPPRPPRLDGQAPVGLLDGLTAQVHAEGYQLLRHDVDLPHPGVGVPNGVTDYLARTVIVRPDLSDAQTTKTLAHELGHVLLHEPTRRPADLTRQQAEVEAESVAHIVGAAHGLDTSGYSVPYVAGWSAGNLALLARSAERVVGTAHRILAHTPPPPTFVLPDSTRTAARDRMASRATARDAARPAAPRAGTLRDRPAAPAAPAPSGPAARAPQRPAVEAPRRSTADLSRQGRLW